MSAFRDLPTRSRSTVPLVASRIGRWARQRPFTATIAVLVVLVRIVGGIVVAVAREGRGTSDPFVTAAGVFRPVSALFVTGGFLALVVTVVAVVVLVGGAERLLGWRRALLAFVVTTVVGTGVGAFAELLDTDGRNAVLLVAARATSFDPWTAIVGTVATASAFAGALWRRRIRVGGAAVVAGLLLYAGRPSDLFATVALVAGLALGALLRRRPVRRGWRRSSHREVRVLMATVVLVTALGPVIALVGRGRTGLLAPLATVLGSGPAAGMPSCRVADVTTSCVRGILAAGPRNPFELVLALMPLTVLVVGGVGLLRGSRFACWLVVVVDGVTGVAAATFYGIVPSTAASTAAATHAGTRRATPLVEDHVVYSLSLVVSVLVPLATAVALVVLRSAFPGPTPGRRIVRFVVVVAAAGLLLAGVVVAVALSDGRTVTDPLRLALTVFGPVAPITLAHHAAHVDPALRRVVDLVGPLLWLVVAVAALRPTGATPVAADAGDRDRARALLVAEGGDAFGWMTTWAGNDYWFSDDARAAVAYRLTGRVAVTVGAPFGVPSERAAALEAFARFCDDHGWTPVFYGVGGDLVPAFRRLGWGTLPVAEDADLDPRTWTPAGRRRQDVRTAVNRARREGITATWSAFAAVPVGVVRQIEAISEEWVADRELPEMGFTLGGVDEMRDPEVRTLVATSADGTVLAVTSWLPSFRAGRVVGWTLDVMRRRGDAPNGVMEFLVASAVDAAREQGAERLSLSAAPLATSDDPAPSAAATSAQDGVASFLDLVGGVLEPVYGFRSLLRFKQKFGPDLHPLVMAFPDPVALPTIGIAVVRTYLPGLSLRQAVSLVRGARTR